MNLKNSRRKPNKSRILSIIFIVFLFFAAAVFIVPQTKMHKVKDVLSPLNILLDSGQYRISGYDCFDPEYTDKNSKLASKFGISEKDAFILGNLGKYWAATTLKGRKVMSGNNDLVYRKYGYRTKFVYSGFCIKDEKPCFDEKYKERLYEAQNGNYKVIDLNGDIVYEPDDERVKTLKNFVVVRKDHLPRRFYKKAENKSAVNNSVGSVLDFGDIRLVLADFTLKTKPDRKCSSDICKEILDGINNSEKTIDMAIYGYSSTREIETALKNAIKRGVKIRLVYDLDSKGGNIYPETGRITEIIKAGKSDRASLSANSIMHNKFYIFDNKKVITGSANLSHTDMSGFNTNSILVINSPKVAEIYKAEFEQMYGGKFHTEKVPVKNKSVDISGIHLDIYFSPQDKALKNAVIPLINSSKNYVYIPAFLVTDREMTEALINAKKRGVDVRLIVDALNASAKHSKHNLLRNGGISIKTENYAGKMHSKSVIVDDKYVIIGSMNFSNSGENKNDENLVVIRSSEMAKFYKKNFLYQWDKIDNKWLKLNARAEGRDSIGSCTDGLDNNYDGFTDAQDPACKG